MTEQADRELQTWMADWQAVAPASGPAEQIRRHARSRNRMATLWVASEWGIGLGALVFLVHRILTQGDPMEQVAMGLLALVTASALGFTWWNWYGALGSQGESTRTYVTLSIERTRRFARAVRAGWVLLAVELAIFTPWVAYRLYSQDPVASPSRQAFGWAWLAGMTALGAAGLVALERWTAREARQLERLRTELEDDAV